MGLRPKVLKAGGLRIYPRIHGVSTRLLGVIGSRLFNLIPDPIRNMKGCTVDQFKASLDTFLATVPDQPTMEGTSRAAETNSLIHQLAMRVDRLQL